MNHQVQEAKKEINHGMEFHMIPVELIVANDDFNCRGKIAPMDVIDLWKSIDEKGLIQPVTLRELDEFELKEFTKQKYALVAGFRRFKAVTLVGNQPTIMARIIKCTAAEAEILNLTENIQRKELNIMQEASSVARFLKRDWTQERIAKELKVSRVWVISRMKLLSLPKEVQEEAAKGIINQSQIAVLFEIRDDKEKMYEMVRKLKDATDRGEKIKTKALEEEIATAPPNVAPKKMRKRQECFDMINFVLMTKKQCLATRALAWAAGEISDDEFKDEVQKS